MNQLFRVLLASTPALLSGVSSAQASLDWFALAPPSAAPYVYARHAAVDTQGRVCAAYWNSSGTGPADVDVVQYSATGSLNWYRRFDSGPASADRPLGIAVASNGDVCVCGSAWGIKGELFVLRYDSSGNLLHRTLFPGFASSDDAIANALAIDAQGNVVVAGNITIGGQRDMIVQAYSPTGALLWDRRIAGAAGGFDNANAILIDPSGDIFVAGSTWDLQVIGDTALVKLSSNGTVQWVRSWGQSLNDEFYSLASDHQGGVVACGMSQFPYQLSSHPGGLVVRYDGSGARLWTDTYPQTPYFNYTYSVLVDSSGVTWALHHVGWLMPSPRVVLTRISPAGVRLSSVPVASSAFPGTLVAGDAGQVFASATTGDFVNNVSQAVVYQYDTGGVLNWQQGFTPVPGSGTLAYGLLRAPNSRLVLHGSATGSTHQGLVFQVDVSAAPHGFCTAKLNSLGCAPSVEFTGVPRASASSGFALRVGNVLNQKPGLFLYSVASAASTPFGGGTLCVGAPVRRTIGVNSGGGPVGIPDCSGTFSIDMNAFAHGALGGTPAVELTIAGTQVWQQAWGRDNGFVPPNDVSLSSGLSYSILP